MEHNNDSDSANRLLVSDYACSTHGKFDFFHSKSVLGNRSEDEEFDHRLAVYLCYVNVFLWNVVSPIYIVAGTLGNILSIIVWSRRKLQRPTHYMSVLLTWLAVFDLLVLYFSFLNKFMRKASYIRWDMQATNAFVCKVSEFLLHCSLDCSVWTVAVLSMERCVRIVFLTPRMRQMMEKVFRRTEPTTPRWRPQCLVALMRRPRSLNAAIGFVVFLSVLANVHIFWTQHRLHNADAVCTMDDETYHNFLEHIRPNIDFVFGVALPGLLILVSTVLLVCAISCCVTGPRIPTIKVHSRLGFNRRSTESAVAKMSGRVTRTLLAISIAFIICNAPKKIYLLVYPVKLPTHAILDHPHEFFILRFVWTLTVFLQSLSNVVSFLIYSVGNELFRREVKLIFCRYLHR